MTEKAPQEQDQLQFTEEKKGYTFTNDGKPASVDRVGDYFVVGWQKRVSSSSSYTESYYSPTLHVCSSEGEFKGDVRQSKISIDLRKLVRLYIPTARYIVGENYKQPNGTSLTCPSQYPEYVRDLLYLRFPKFKTSDEASYDFNDSRLEYEVDFGKSLPSGEIYGGKYIASRKGEPTFIIQVRNDSGAPLSKDQWIYFKPDTDPTTFPEDLKAWYESAEKGAKYFTVAPGFDGKVGTQGLEIFAQGDYSKALYKDGTVTDDQTNFATLKSTPPVLYSIGHDQPAAIKMLQLDGDASKWQMRQVQLPPELRFPEVRTLQIDPTGNFLLLEIPSGVIALTSDTLTKIGEIKKAMAPSFDSSGRFSVIKNGTITFMNANFTELAAKRDLDRQKRIAANLNVNELFMTEQEQRALEARSRAEVLKPLVDDVTPEFSRKSQEVRVSRSVSGIKMLENALENLRIRLSASMPGQQSDVSAIVELMQTQFVDPVRREIYQQTVGAAVARLQSELQGSLSLQSLSYLSQNFEELKEMIPFLEDIQKDKVFEIGRQLQLKTSEFLAAHSHEFTEQAKRYVETAKAKLDSFTSKAEIEAWVEYEYPALLTQLGTLQRQCPTEAIDAIRSITQARSELGELVATYEAKFKREYAKVRETAAEQNAAIGQNLDQEIKRFVERLQERKFTRRSEAEQYVASSPTFRQINLDIETLLQRDPVRGKSVAQAFEVVLSQFYYAVDQQSRVTVAQSGQQMVLLGDREFPVWERKVKEKQKRQISLQFKEDKETHGPGVSRDQIMGDVMIRVVGTDGKEDLVQPYQALGGGDDYRLGLISTIYGTEFSPSYVNGQEYLSLRRDASDWQKGDEQSLIRREVKARRQKLRELYNSRPQRGPFPPGAAGDADFQRVREQWDTANREKYSQLFKEYGSYLAEKHVSLLKRIDAISDQPDTIHANGKGYVPEWQSHWVVDPQTEDYLEKMAEVLQMQLELQEGMMLLKGHAGTGKDVLVKMFCEKTHRPYFAIDCTKWTTEFELSEDITLESVNGASQTMRVPSVVLNAITTPGAVMYFNELNAMPEQAQIFLHSLLDEKRSLTLKTSSGRTIKADSSVLIIGSMNPGYPGTFEPQFATRSRTVSIDIEYPPLKRENDPNDPNRGDKPFNVSEALRIARGVESLQSMTYEVDLTRNTFVKAWDSYVNNIGTAPTLSLEQKFDLEVILALVQFGDELRQKFINTFEKKGGSKNLTVTQPITSREMRRCAWALNQIPASEKANIGTAEDRAKAFIERYFLTHIDDSDQRNKLAQHMRANMHAKKRTGA